MSLRDVSAQLSTSGSVQLTHVPTGKVIQSLRLVQASPEHKAFIISTWVKSYRGTARRAGYGKLYDLHEPQIAESRWADCLVATDEDGYTVYAWVCGSNGDLHHCYVIPELRRLRVATRMIEAACGHLLNYARRWPYQAHAPVNPYLMCVKNGQGSPRVENRAQDDSNVSEVRQ